VETDMEEAINSRSGNRIAGIAFVALLHVAILYALISGLGTTAVELLQKPLTATIIQPPAPPKVQAPPPPPPQLVQPPPPYIPPPLIQVAQPPPVPVIATVTHVKPPAPTPRVAAPVTSSAGLDPNQSCAPPDYPQEAEDMGQTGTSVVQFLIGADGSVQQSRVAQSSGHSSLDNAAVRALSACHFKPAIGADGKPQQAWATIPYVWQLN
jgi:protein TonB